MTLRAHILAIIGLMLCILAASCNREPVPAPHLGKPAGIAAAVVSGLGESQVGDISDYLEKNLPDVTVQTFPSRDGYKSDVEGTVSALSYSKLALIGHSYGANRVVEDSAKLPHVDLLILFDPVALSGEDLTIPPNVGRCIVFYRERGFNGKAGEAAHSVDLIDPFSARIHGANVERYTLPGGHSDGCHNVKAIVAIAGDIGRLQ